MINGLDLFHIDHVVDNNVQTKKYKFDYIQLLHIWNCEMEKYNLVNKFGREFNNAFTLLQVFNRNSHEIVTPLSK